MRSFFWKSSPWNSEKYPRVCVDVWPELADRWNHKIWHDHSSHLSYLPVDIPLLHVGEPPRGDRQARGHVDANQTVVWDAKNLILLTAFEPETQTTIKDSKNY